MEDPTKAPLNFECSLEIRDGSSIIYNVEGDMLKVWHSIVSAENANFFLEGFDWGKEIGIKIGRIQKAEEFRRVLSEART